MAAGECWVAVVGWVTPYGKPLDRYRMVYAVFVWLGIGTLLPWNFFITVSSYWNYKYRLVNDTYDSYQVEQQVKERGETFVPLYNEVKINWGWQMAVASMVPNVTILTLNAVFGHRFKTQPRLLVSLIMVIVLFSFTAALAVVDSDEWQQTFLIVTLISVVLININAAIFQSGLLGVAGRFPPKYIGGVFSGQAVGGIFSSVTNVLMIGFGADPVYAAFFCFLFAVAFLSVALVFYVWLTRSEFFQHYLGENEVVGTAGAEKGDAKIGRFPEEDNLVSDGPSQPPSKVVVPAKVNPLVVFQKIVWYALSVYLVFVVTLACFPALTVLVVSVNEDQYPTWTSKFFIPVCCFVLFNVGDFLGRLAAEMFQWPKPGKFGMMFTFSLSILRFIFVPLFLMCNASPEHRVHTANYFQSDIAYIYIMAMFSLSNGYLASIALISAPQLCVPEEQPTAAGLAVALLGLGLGSGALLSSAVVSLL